MIFGPDQGATFIAAETIEQSLSVQHGEYFQMYLDPEGGMAFDMPRSGYGDPDWEPLKMVDEATSTTAAHVAAEELVLPADFPYWDRQNKDGLPVAHIAAHCNNLPEDFEQWDIRAGEDSAFAGQTVVFALVTADNPAIPFGFNRWHDKATNGLSITRFAREIQGQEWIASMIMRTANERAESRQAAKAEPKI